MRSSEFLFEFYSPEEDGNNLKITNSRRPKLTLRHISKLRKIKEYKRMEEYSRKKFLPIMYSSSPESGGGIPGM